MVLGGLASTAGPLFAGLTSVFANIEQTVQATQNKALDTLKDAAFGQQKSVEDFRAEAMAELGKIEAAIEKAHRMRDETSTARDAFRENIGVKHFEDAIAPHKSIINETMVAMTESAYCVNDAKIWINDIDRSLITLEDIILNRIDPNKGTIEQTNAQRAAEGISKNTAKALAFETAAKAENAVMEKGFAEGRKFNENLLKKHH